MSRPIRPFTPYAAGDRNVEGLRLQADLQAVPVVPREPSNAVRPGSRPPPSGWSRCPRLPAMPACPDADSRTDAPACPRPGPAEAAGSRRVRRVGRRKSPATPAHGRGRPGAAAPARSTTPRVRVLPKGVKARGSVRTLETRVFRPAKKAFPFPK